MRTRLFGDSPGNRRGADVAERLELFTAGVMRFLRGTLFTGPVSVYWAMSKGPIPPRRGRRTTEINTDLIEYLTRIWRTLARVPARVCRVLPCRREAKIRPQPLAVAQLSTWLVLLSRRSCSHVGPRGHCPTPAQNAGTLFPKPKPNPYLAVGP